MSVQTAYGVEVEVGGWVCCSVVYSILISDSCYLYAITTENILYLPNEDWLNW